MSLIIDMGLVRKVSEKNKRMEVIYAWRRARRCGLFDVVSSADVRRLVNAKVYLGTGWAFDRVCSMAEECGRVNRIIGLADYFNDVMRASVGKKYLFAMFDCPKCERQMTVNVASREDHFCEHCRRDLLTAFQEALL